MTELPRGWATAQVGDLLEGITAGKNLKCEERPPEAHERGVIKVSAVTWGTFDASRAKTLPVSYTPAPGTDIKAGDFLFSRANTLELVGAVVLVKGDHPNLFLSDKILRLDFPPELKPWLLVYLQSLEGRRKLGDVSSGNQMSMRNIGQSSLKSVSVPLPPLPEQHRIVAKIEELFSELDAGEASLTRARAQLALYRQSLLKAAFQGRLTADWRAANPDKLEPPETLLSRIRKERETRYKQALDDWQTALSEWRAGGEKGRKPGKPSRPADGTAIPSERISIPDLWTLQPLGGLAYSAELGKMLDQAKNMGTPRPYLGNINLRWGAFNVAHGKTMPIEDHEIDRYGICAGDLVICEGGEPGRCAVWIGQDNLYFIQKALHRVRFTDSYLPYFAFYFMAYAAKSGLLEQHFTGSTIKHLTASSLAEVAFPVCSKEEQAKIVDLLDSQMSALDATETEITTTLARISALRQSILKQAFSGQLVPQDPSDEPASALLSRLRATAPAPKTRRKIPA